MKFCIKCEETKPKSDFSKGSGTMDLHSYCKKCNHQNRATWNQVNPEKKRDQRLYQQYRLRPEQLQELLESQDFKCLICEKAFGLRNSYHIDHDHTHCPTKNSCGLCIRGILCPGCNNKIWWHELWESKITLYLARPNPITKISPRRRGTDA